jgi:hypothetical protein
MRVGAVLRIFCVVAWAGCCWQAVRGAAPARCGGYGGNAHVHTVGGTTGGPAPPLQQLPLVAVLGCVKTQ